MASQLPVAATASTQTSAVVEADALKMPADAANVDNILEAMADSRAAWEDAYRCAIKYMQCMEGTLRTGLAPGTRDRRGRRALSSNVAACTHAKP